jgi:NhaA family Na+:H+ antiporter
VARTRPLSKTFKDFFESEKSGGILLVVCTLASLVLANGAGGHAYTQLWHAQLGGLSVEHWINDGLMAVFFLLIGLELERELYVGELSDFRNALLPIVAAGGGVVVPALIHLSLNAGTPTQAGIGIPMATDIAFALGVLAIVGSSVPASLKVFLAALAVMDDLVAVVVIALFYSSDLSIGYLVSALAVFAALLALNRLRVMALFPYLVGGILMWFLMLRSGVHATLAGVLLAFAVPFGTRETYRESPSYRLEHLIQRPVAFAVLPLFALANTAIVIGSGALGGLAASNSVGIMTGLYFGKPVGISLASFAAVKLGVCRLPGDLRWKHIVGAGMLGGIGFTMSIFITNLAFEGRPETINASKMAILLASLVAGATGYVWLKLGGAPVAEPAEPLDDAAP